MTTQLLTPQPLVAEEAPHSQQVDISFTFTGGIGQGSAVLFRNGVLINMQSISKSGIGIIKFSEVQTGDVISVNGVCAGNTEITVSTSTVPVTPKQFNPGLIMANFLIN
jgi:hypothetical protein